jgi:hypothetical protein
MDADLSSIIAADEEARARVQAARTAAANRVDEVRRNIEDERALRLAALRAQAARTVAAIEEQVGRTVAERTTARARSIAARRHAAEAALEAAADLYARIVIRGVPRREPA